MIAAVGGQLPAEDLELTPHTGTVPQMVDVVQQLVHLERFPDVLVSARLQGGHGLFHRRVRRDHDHGRVGIAADGRLEDVHPRGARQSDVGDHQVERALFDVLQRPRAVPGADDLTPLLGQHARHQRAQRGLVFDEQDRVRHGSP